MRDLLRGKLVRFTAEEPETRAKAEVGWQRDSELHRLASDSPIMFESQKKLKESFEKRIGNGFQPQRYSFSVRTLDGDHHIGFLGMWLNLVHSEGWVGLGIGDREFWGRGYGTDMMNLCLRYAFTELNLRRMSLGLMEYNPRALRSYEKAGFRLEGRTRADISRDGNRYDSLWMGILREEWFQMQKEGTL